GASAVGLVALPVDGGATLWAGLKGALFSLPELFFQNIRKGSFEHIRRNEREGSVARPPVVRPPVARQPVVSPVDAPGAGGPAAHPSVTVTGPMASGRPAGSGSQGRR